MRAVCFPVKVVAFISGEVDGQERSEQIWELIPTKKRVNALILKNGEFICDWVV